MTCLCCRALRQAYMQSGGSDPAIVARMIDLQVEAQSLEKNQSATAVKSKTQSDDEQKLCGACHCTTVNTALFSLLSWILPLEKLISNTSSMVIRYYMYCAVLWMILILGTHFRLMASFAFWP